MAGEKRLVKVYVEKIIEWEIFLAVDEDADVEDVALGLINDDVIEESAEGDPIFKSQSAPTKEETKNMIFLDEEGNELAVESISLQQGTWSTDTDGIMRGTVKAHVK
jgi:hypothetical protein